MALPGYLVSHNNHHFHDKFWEMLYMLDVLFQLCNIIGITTAYEGNVRLIIFSSFLNPSWVKVTMHIRCRADGKNKWFSKFHNVIFFSLKKRRTTISYRESNKFHFLLSKLKSFKPVIEYIFASYESENLAKAITK